MKTETMKFLQCTSFCVLQNTNVLLLLFSWPFPNSNFCFVFSNILNLQLVFQIHKWGLQCYNPEVQYQLHTWQQHEPIGWTIKEECQPPGPNFAMGNCFDQFISISSNNNINIKNNKITWHPIYIYLLRSIPVTF